MRIVELPHKPTVIKYGAVPSPVGDCTVAWCKEGICALYVATREQAENELKKVWDDKCVIIRSEVDLDPFAEDATVAIYGTPFQKRVWRALAEIPTDKTMSYSQLAEKIGVPKAVRAVASAVARNEVSILIPCHLIVRRDGTIGQYRWGTEVKQQLLLNLNPH